MQLTVEKCTLRASAISLSGKPHSTCAWKAAFSRSYHAYYSNKSWGIRLKQGMARPGDELLARDAEVEIIDVSEYEPRKLPSKTWRQYIKKILDVNSLECQNSGGDIKVRINYERQACDKK